MKTIFLTWLLALITHNSGWQIPIGGYFEAPSATNKAKTAKGELLQLGSDALLLLQDGTLIGEFYVLQDVNTPISGFTNRYFDFSPGTEKIGITLSDGDIICLKNTGVRSEEAANAQVFEGGGLTHFRFNTEVNYKRFVDLLLEYKNYQQALNQIDYELLVNPENGGPGEQDKGPTIPPAANCGSCGSGGYGAVSCSISTGSYSCSVQCPNNYWACCSPAGGCRCCQ